jgi:hypothetical protein
MMRVQEPVRNGRLLNRFTLGCDAEVFNSGSLVQTVGYLSSMLPGGVKVKPAPSRSSLEVTAGVWKALRVLDVYIASGDVVTANPFVEAVSIALGGHVHFGRKSSHRVAEVEALDNLTHALMEVGLFNRTLASRRLKGDMSYRKYGLPSDVRLKPWGWEYRSLPTFLSSPWMCFLVLTLAKLTVLAAPEVRSWNRVVASSESRLRTLLARFRGVDDDAALAYWLLAKHGWPKPDTLLDIRQAWGLDKARKSGIVYPLPRWSYPTTTWIAYTYDRLCGRVAAMPVETFVPRKEVTGSRESWQFSIWKELHTALVGLRGRTGHGVDTHVNGPDVFLPSTVTPKDFETIKRFTKSVKYGPPVQKNVSVRRSWILKDSGAPEKLISILCVPSLGFSMDGPPKVVRAKSLKIKGLLFDSADVARQPKKIEFYRYVPAAARAANRNIER